ncbi:MAG: branched-chain amino acid ABC transporter permease [Pseudomonadota bacterium]
MLTALAIVIDGLIEASYLFLVALGLTLICGVMKILNVAHGSFYAFGAYASATIIGWWFATGLPGAGSFVMMVAVAVALGCIFGLILEVGLLKRMYGRDEVIIVLVTFASFLMLEDVIIWIWGGNPYFAFEPYSLLGETQFGTLIYSNYDFALIALAVGLAVLTWILLNRTSQGRLLLAVIHDPELAAAFGINVNRYFTMTFIIGAALGCLGGAVMAPKISVAPGIGVEVIVLAFAIVVIGGMGSIWGAIVGALTVGLTRAASVHLFPQAELFVIYAVMTLVLVFRPEGLFMRQKARKI